MILVDTNVWINFFKGASPAAPLKNLLLQGEVSTHSWIVAEITLGHLGKHQETILHDISILPHTPLIDINEINQFIKTENLSNKGIGLVDVHLLYSAIVSNQLIWTVDKSLKAQCARYNIDYN